MNKAFLMGTVESDPTVRMTPAGAKSVNFRMATRESFKGRDGQDQERTEWHNIACWGQSADLAEGLRKGDLCLVEGRIQTRSWDDATSGQKKYMTEVNVRELEKVGAGQSQERSQPSGGGYGGGGGGYGGGGGGYGGGGGRQQSSGGGGGGRQQSSGGGGRSNASPDTGRSNSGGKQNDESFDDVPF